MLQSNGISVIYLILALFCGITFVVLSALSALMLFTKKPAKVPLRIAAVLGSLVVGLGALAIGIILSVATIVSAAKNKGNQASSSAGGFVVEAKDKSCQIRLPQGWTQEASLNASAVISAKSADALSYLIIIVDPKNETFSKLDYYGPLIADAMVHRLTNGTRTQGVARTVGGKPGLRYDISGNYQNLDFSYHLTCLQGDHAMFQLLEWTTKEKQNQAWSVFDSIDDSFVETPK